MSLVELAGMAAKAVGGARWIARMTGNDAPVLDQLHQGLRPVRFRMMEERVVDAATGSGAAQPPESTDWTGDGGPGMDAGGDISAPEGSGLLADVIAWISDHF
jgi:hypothetical protein